MADCEQCAALRAEVERQYDQNNLADAAIAVALEGVARVISEMPRTHTTVKMCDVMGMKAEVTLTLNNGPAECAAAIRAMIKEG